MKASPISGSNLIAGNLPPSHVEKSWNGCLVRIICNTLFWIAERINNLAIRFGGVKKNDALVTSSIQNSRDLTIIVCTLTDHIIIEEDQPQQQEEKQPHSHLEVQLPPTPPLLPPLPKVLKTAKELVNERVSLNIAKSGENRNNNITIPKGGEILTGLSNLKKTGIELR